MRLLLFLFFLYRHLNVNEFSSSKIFAINQSLVDVNTEDSNMRIDYFED